jgi:hypothetical protein
LGLALLLAAQTPPALVDPADRAPATRPAAELPIDAPSVTPVKNPGYLNIATLPWSRVYIDGHYRGVTPLARVVLAPGRHRLRFLNDEAGLEAEQEVVINAQETTWVRRGLSKGEIGKKLTWVARELPDPTERGTLEVQTAPPTTVFVDGQRRGQTPLKLDLAAGLHFVWMVNEAAGIEAAKRVDVKVGALETLKLTLEPGSGYLAVDLGLVADVIVDGRPRGKSPLRLKLPCGPHEVVVRNRGAGLTLTQQVQVRLGETTHLELLLSTRSSLEEDRVEEDEP